MNLTLHVWRQKGPHDPGRMVRYEARDVSPDMSFLEMLDVVNQGLVEKGEEPIAFDHDCREGICGSCCLMINGRAHGPERGVATCQTYMRNFKDGDADLRRAVAGAGRSRWSRTWWWTAAPSTGSSRRAATCRSTPAARRTATTCRCRSRARRRRWTRRRASAAAPAWRRARTPRPCCSRPPRCRTWRCCRRATRSGRRRVRRMVEQMDKEGFGDCTNHYECEAACPKEISVEFIAKMNREYLAAVAAAQEE